MKEIKLSKGLVTQVDDDNFEYLNQFKWYALINHRTIYAQRVVQSNNKKQTLKMHRIIMNTPNELEVDHKDGNGLNNQRSNLRNCIHRDNCKNKKSSSKSKYLGVSLNPKGIALARITHNGQRINLGSFRTIIDAAHAYDEAAIKYHGEFANLNFK